MIFPTGQHQLQDVVLTTRSATLRQIQGEVLHPHDMDDTALACFGRIPWIDSQGAQQACQRQETMSKMMASATAATPTTRQDGDDGDNGTGEGEVDSDGVNDNEVNNHDDVNVDIVEDDIDDGTTTMRW